MNYQYWQELTYQINKIDEHFYMLKNKAITQDMVEQIREKMEERTSQIKNYFRQHLDKEYADLILFALLASIDEMMKNLDDLRHAGLEWKTLVFDEFSHVHAGEEFYRKIDSFFDNPKTPSIIFEVYYYFLKRGFKGKYKDSRTQISKYMEILQSKMPVANDTYEHSQEGKASLPSIQSRRKWHYYTAALILMICTMTSLFILADIS